LKACIGRIFSSLAGGFFVWKLLLVFRGLLAFVCDYAGGCWGDAGFSGFTAGYLAHVQDFLFALFHGELSGGSALTTAA
jgi:hypothetical protein